MSDTPWMPFYVKDWLVGTRTLTYEQRGVYLELLCLSWENVPIPVDNLLCRKLVQCDSRVWNRVWPALERFWPVVDGERRNHRLESERSRRDSRRGKLSDAGKRGAGRRWGGYSQAIASPSPGYSEAYGMPQSQSQPQYDSEQRSLTIVAPARAGDATSLTLSPGQLQAGVSGLVGAWNNVAAVVEPLIAVEGVRSHPKATAALRAHPDIDWWADVFRRVALSDFLRGLEPLRDGRRFIADFWWVLEHADAIAAGRYDNRDRSSGNAAVLDKVLRDLA